ncbi:hypothetical protein LIER_28891 [Lithospermum erythrorhizon]|uniref:Uncharacterized protein n=1 Tax=Lithospermum erythrorhizon TaxID=34254 RepID=A0AAV3RHP6_LITER
MSSSLLSPMFCNDNAEKNRILASLSAPIIALGLPSTIFEMETINNAFFMFKNYHKLVKFVSYLAEMGILEDCVKDGVTKGLISSPQQCTVEEFAAWASWLKTAEGQQIIHNAQLTKKLKKSVAEGETLVKEEVDAASYELYVAEARAKGRVALEWNQFKTGIIDVDMYHRKIYEANEKIHANNPIYRKEIEVYLARNIVEFRNSYDKKGEKKVYLLGIIMGKEAVDDVIRRIVIKDLPLKNMSLFHPTLLMEDTRLEKFC